MEPSAKHRAAAALVEASDHALLLVFSSFTLEQRLCFATVSRRWQQLLLSELRFPSWLIWRLPTVLQRAGSALRVLDVSVVRADNLEEPGALAELVQSLSGTAGAELRTLIVCDGTVGSLSRFVAQRREVLSPKQALQLIASCPRLDASTRLAVYAAGASEAIALLNALPGRHAVELRPPMASIDERDALRTLLRHPRLADLSLRLSERSDAPHGRAWLDAALAAILDALSPQGQLEGCSLHRLWLNDERAGMNPPGAVAFPDAAAVAQALAGRAAAGGPTAAAPLQRCSLESFFYTGCGVPRAFVRGVLAATCGSLRRLHCGDALGDGRLVPDAAPAGPAALTALLEHIGPSLETLSFTDDGESSLLPGIAPLLASPACRLRSLSVGQVDFDKLRALEEANSEAGAAAGADLAQAALAPFRSILHALAANRSLRDLRFAGLVDLGAPAAMHLGAALAARACPLDSLHLPLSNPMVPNCEGALMQASRRCA